MNKRLLMAVGALFLLLFATGCPGPEEPTTTIGKAFVGGSQGLEITFLTGLPPSDVFDTDNPFQVGLKIENKGEFSIDNKNDIQITITGINPEDFGVTSAQLSDASPDPLQGRRLDGAGNVIQGDFTTVEFPEMQYVNTISGSIPFTIRANVCYEYGTKAQGKLCIAEDLRGITGEPSICDPNRVIPAENSGAPIQITNFRQNVAGPNKVDFFFTIRKTSGVTDSLFKKGSSCDPLLANRDVVWVDVSETGLGTLTCSGLREGTTTTGFVTLFNNEREIRCSQVVDDPADLEKVIDIELTYAYKEFIDRTLNVKHAE